MLRTIITTVVGSVLSAALVAWLITPAAESPQVDVVQHAIVVPIESGNSLGLDGVVQSKRHWSGYLLQSYRITNTSSRIYDNLTIRLKNFSVASYEYRDGGASIPVGVDKTFRLEPGEALSINGFSDGVINPYGGFYSGGDILVSMDGVTFPVRNDLPNSEPMTSAEKIAFDYPILGAALLIYFVLGGMLMTVAIFFGVVNEVWPTFIFKWYSDKELGKLAVLLAALKRGYPERYAVVVKKAQELQRTYLADVKPPAGS